MITLHCLPLVKNHDMDVLFPPLLQMSMMIIYCQPSNDGNSSISRITFPAEVEDMGSSLSCRASNPNVPASALEDSWALNIYCELNYFSNKCTFPTFCLCMPGSNEYSNVPFYIQPLNLCSLEFMENTLLKTNSHKSN